MTRHDPAAADPRRVLAAVDMSSYTRSVADHAAWAAARLDAPLTLLHVLDPPSALPPATDLSGSLDLGARSKLLAELADVDAQRSRLAQERGRLLLQELASQISAGHELEVTSTLRNGSLVESLTRLEEQVRLFVIGKRGEHADFDRGHLGSQLERVARAVHRPLLVAARNFRPIRNVLIAFDGSPTTRKGVQMIAASALFAGLRIEVVMVGSGSDSQRRELDWARAQLADAGFDVTAHLLPGDPEQAIAGAVEAGNIHLLVMGAYGHSRIRRLIVGSTTTALLRTCKVPVLLLR